MKRREFILALGGAAAWPLPLSAQQPERMRRIAVLNSLPADDLEGQARHAAFLQGLQEFGWAVGRNVQIDTRWGGGDADRIRKIAAELAVRTPDVIFATGGITVGPLLQATRTLPIVFVIVPDPVGASFVDSLARPGGNATGFLILEFGLSGKWVELLKEIAPGVTRVAVIRDPNLTSVMAQLGAIQAVAPALSVDVSPVNVRDVAEIERAIATFARSANSGLIVTASPAAAVHRDRSSRWPPATGCPVSTMNATSSPPAAWFPMALISSTSFGARLLTSTASSRARSRPTCRCRRRPSTNWSSISRPRKRSASMCRQPCSPAPTR